MPPIAADLTEIGLIPHDEAAMLGFYRDVVGLEVRGDSALPIGVNRRHAHAGIGIKIMCLKKTPPAPVRGLSRTQGFRLLSLLGDEAWYETRAKTVAEAGITPRRIVETSTAKVLFLRDPDGNLVEIAGLKPSHAPAPAVQLGIAAADPERLAAYYARTFGLQTRGPVPHEDGPPTFEVEWPPIRLNIWASDADAEALVFEPPAARAGIRYLTARIGGLGAAVEAVGTSGGQITVAPLRIGDLAEIAFVADPAGANLELVSVLKPPTSH